MLNTLPRIFRVNTTYNLSSRPTALLVSIKGVVSSINPNLNLLKKLGDYFILSQKFEPVLITLLFEAFAVDQAGFIDMPRDNLPHTNTERYRFVI
jgi:hypothetical protein